VTSSAALGHANRMSNQFDSYPHSDVCLLLRAHAEQRWLSREVIPVVRQIETGEHLPEEQIGAALAYLEITWIEAVRRAEETDTARSHLDDAPVVDALSSEETPHAQSSERDLDLCGRARRYFAAVHALRETAARRVASLLDTPVDVRARARH
jgi:hypothetical protein